MLITEHWRQADGPGGIVWPLWSVRPSAQWMSPRIWGWANCSVSMTGAWGRPYLWIGPVLIVF
jgi:hypothetical protein